MGNPGSGDPKKRTQGICDVFPKADGSHPRQFGGTGLGLAITRRLVSLMGGRLWAESEPGRGSSFFVELPMTPGQPVEAREPLPNAATPALAGKLRVLVAEDNPTNQKVICTLLRRQGWTITLAQNGEEAFRCFLEAGYDLVLMDVQMPVVDGLESTRLIREAESARGLRRTPILALTAHASQVQHDQCLAAGMDAVITKPVNLRGLLAQIAAVVTTTQPV